MSAPARQLARAIHDAAGRQVERRSLRSVEVIVEGIDPARYDVAGMDVELDEEDVQIGGLLGSVLEASPLKRGDTLVCVEVEEGNYIAVDLMRAVAEASPLATGAQLAAHAALHKGVHGLPAVPTNGRGVIWNNGTQNWDVAPDFATVAAMTAADAALAARIADFELGIIGVAPVTVASPVGTIGFTTADVSATVPAGFTTAVLRVTIGGTRNSNGAFGSNNTQFRKDAASQVVAQVGMSFANAAATSAGMQKVDTIRVPLTAARTFQYNKTEAAGLGSSGATIELIGYQR